MTMQRKRITGNVPGTIFRSPNQINLTIAEFVIKSRTNPLGNPAVNNRTNPFVKEDIPLPATIRNAPRFLGQGHQGSPSTRYGGGTQRGPAMKVYMGMTPEYYYDPTRFYRGLKGSLFSPRPEVSSKPAVNTIALYEDGYALRLLTKNRVKHGDGDDHE